MSATIVLTATLTDDSAKTRTITDENSSKALATARELLAQVGTVGFSVAGATVPELMTLYPPAQVKSVAMTLTLAAPQIFRAPNPKDLLGTAGFDKRIEIMFTRDGADTSVYYTLDGSTPTAEKTLWDGEPVVLTATTTVKAISIREGCTDSAVTSITLTKI